MLIMDRCRSFIGPIPSSSARLNLALLRHRLIDDHSVERERSVAVGVIQCDRLPFLLAAIMTDG